MSSHSGGVTPPGGQEISCSCGATRFVCTGKPIMVTECYCDSCREAGAILEALPGAPTVAELKWEKFFADRQLLKIIEMALSNNRDLRLAALNVERARALYGIQRAQLFPTVTAAAAVR